MIVFIHGWGMSKAIFQPFVDRYLEGRDVLLLDLPGYGEGEWLENFDAQVLQLAKEIPKGSHVVAWSLAGLYALRLASLMPNHLSRITMLCSTPSFVQKNNFQHALTLNVLDQFSESLVKDHKKTIERFLLLQLHGQKQAKEIARTIRESILDKSNIKKQVLVFGLECLKKIDCRIDLKNSKIPVHFILGERDKLVPYQMSESIKNLNPNISVSIIDKAAHIPFVTHELFFLKALFKQEAL